MMNNKKGFTLIELLVVILIVGILAAIALPQYKRAVEKTKMAEAVTVVRAIADAQQRYYMVHNNYLTCAYTDDLDIDFSNFTNATYPACGGKQSNHFIYLASNYGGTFIAFAQRKPLYKYYMYVTKVNPNRIRCSPTGSGNDYQPSRIQKELCDALDANGTL